MTAGRPPTPGPFGGLAESLRGFVEAGGVPGLICGVVAPSGETVIECGTMPDGAAGPTRETPMAVGSLSKILTTLALCELVNEKKLSLSDPVEKFLPAGVRFGRPGGERMTVEHLAVHTSGLPTGVGIDEWRKLGTAGGWAALDPQLAALGPVTPPGERFVYSNLGMALLGRIVESVDGRPYEELIRARILDPLGMRHTTVTLPAGVPLPLFHFVSGIFAPAGGFCSRLSDLLIWARALVGEAPPAFRAALELTRPQRGSDLGGRPLFLGWHLYNPGHLAHSGLTHAFLGFDADAGVAVTILCTGQTPHMDPLGTAVLCAATGRPAVFPAPGGAMLSPERG